MEIAGLSDASIHDIVRPSEPSATAEADEVLNNTAMQPCRRLVQEVVDLAAVLYALQALHGGSRLTGAARQAGSGGGAASGLRRGRGGPRLAEAGHPGSRASPSQDLALIRR